MRHLILALVLGMAVTSNALASTCATLPLVWAVNKSMVRAAVVSGFEEKYANAPETNVVTDLIQTCLIRKIDFFVDSIILHCHMGVGARGAEIKAYDATLTLCLKELGFE